MLLNNQQITEEIKEEIKKKNEKNIDKRKTSGIMRRMQIQSTQRYHLTAVRMTISKMSINRY